MEAAAILRVTIGSTMSDAYTQLHKAQQYPAQPAICQATSSLTIKQLALLQAKNAWGYINRAANGTIFS